MQQQRDYFKDVLLGIAVGDALGVPYEFRSRQDMKLEDVTFMKGFGTWPVPAGTWSDDSSLAFCLAESLIHGFSLHDLAGKFVNWLNKGYWTATGEVFDVGNTTRSAIRRLQEGIEPELSGDDDEFSNGNGSLMRILPLVFSIYEMPIRERYELTAKVSGITHSHATSVIACFYYLEFARLLMQNMDAISICKELKSTITSFLQSIGIDQKELGRFKRLLKEDIQKSEFIRSDGYVIHTLESSIWCLLRTNNYKDAVCEAVSLGGDTDTTAAVTGGLAGLLYGHETIPGDWLIQLAKRDKIEDLAKRLMKVAEGAQIHPLFKKYAISTDEIAALASLYIGGLWISKPYYPSGFDGVNFEVCLKNDHDGSLLLFDRLFSKYKFTTPCGLSRLFLFDSEDGYNLFMNDISSLILMGYYASKEQSKKEDKK